MVYVAQSFEKSAYERFSLLSPFFQRWNWITVLLFLFVSWLNFKRDLRKSHWMTSNLIGSVCNLIYSLSNSPSQRVKDNEHITSKFVDQLSINIWINIETWKRLCNQEILPFEATCARNFYPAPRTIDCHYP